MKERCEKLLKIFIEQDEARAYEMQEAQEIVASTKSSTDVNTAKKKLASLKKELGRRQSTEDRSAWVIQHMQKHNKIVSQYSAAIDLLTPLFQKIPPNAYKRQCISLTFKKSADKKKSALRMLPTNLHLCWWRVWTPTVLPVEDRDFEDLTTVAAGGTNIKHSSTLGGSRGGSRVSRLQGITRVSKADHKRESMAQISPFGLTGPGGGSVGSGSVGSGSSTLPVQDGRHMRAKTTDAAASSGSGFIGLGGEEKDDSDDEYEGGGGGASATDSFQKSFYADGKGENDTVYDTITFGAPAAHVLGFKKGGLRALILKRQKLLSGEHEQESEEDKYTKVQWYYKDEENTEQGPWDTASMREWYKDDFLNPDLLTR